MKNRQKGVALVGKFSQSLYVTIWYFMIFYLARITLFYNNEVEHGEHEDVGAGSPSAHNLTTVPQPQPEFIEPENEEEPEYSNYGTLTENDLDEIQERQNANELQIAHTHAALNLPHDEQEEPPRELENATLVNSESSIEHIKIAQQFIKEISEVTLDNGKLDAEVIECLQSLQEEPIEILDPDIRLSLDLFMACENASQKMYSDVRDSTCGSGPLQCMAVMSLIF